jgi:hypothetical protein
MTYFDKIIADIDRFRDAKKDITLFEASLLVTIKKLCETGNLLEAENADLRNEIRALQERC